MCTAIVLARHELAAHHFWFPRGCVNGCQTTCKALKNVHECTRLAGCPEPNHSKHTLRRISAPPQCYTGNSTPTASQLRALSACMQCLLMQVQCSPQHTPQLNDLSNTSCTREQRQHHNATFTAVRAVQHNPSVLPFATTAKHSTPNANTNTKKCAHCKAHTQMVMASDRSTHTCHTTPHGNAVLVQKQCKPKTCKNNANRFKHKRKQTKVTCTRTYCAHTNMHQNNQLHTYKRQQNNHKTQQSKQNNTANVSQLTHTKVIHLALTVIHLFSEFVLCAK